MGDDLQDASGFMGFWSDIDADYERAYQEWHNCEHMAERVAIPGFIEGRRYRAVSGAPLFFMCYLTRGPEVLGSAPYLAALNRPTPWTREALTHFRNPVRTLYRRHVYAGASDRFRPYIVLVRFDDDRPAGVLAARLSATVAADAATAGAFNEVDEAISGIMTAERRIYSGGPGRQQYLAAIEAPDRATAADAERRLKDALGPGIRDAHAGTYWLEARIRASDVARAADAHDTTGDRDTTGERAAS